MQTTKAEEGVASDLLQIFISGLTPGETFGIYTLQGQLIYQARSPPPPKNGFTCATKDVYILRHKKTYKFNR